MDNFHQFGLSLCLSKTEPGIGIKKASDDLLLGQNVMKNQCKGSLNNKLPSLNTSTISPCFFPDYFSSSFAPDPGGLLP